MGHFIIVLYIHLKECSLKNNQTLKKNEKIKLKKWKKINFPNEIDDTITR